MARDQCLSDVPLRREKGQERRSRILSGDSRMDEKVEQVMPLIEEPDDPQYKAKKAVGDYWQSVKPWGRSRPELVTVWFCYILGGWKTLLFCKTEPDNYFEVTYNTRKAEMYVDHYVKVNNHVIREEALDVVKKVQQEMREET